MRNSAEIATEVWRRVDVVEAKASLRKLVTAIICCMIAVAGFVCLAAQQEELTGIDRASASARPPLAFQAVGGYVLIGVVCFALGIVVTLLCLRVRKRNGSSNRNTQNEKREGERK